MSDSVQPKVVSAPDFCHDIFYAFKLREDCPQSFKNLSEMPPEILTQFGAEKFVAKSVRQHKSSEQLVNEKKEKFRACLLNSLVQHKFADAFKALNDVLYRQPNEKEQAWFKQNGVPENTPIYIKQPRAVRANIELKQRALSFIEAAWKVACICQPQKNLVQLELTQMYLFKTFDAIQAKIDNAGHNLTDPNYFNYFLDEMEQGLVGELKRYLSEKCNVNKETSRVLNQFEAIANWERQSKLDKGFAVMTPGVVRVSIPKKIEMTESQKQEFSTISTGKKPKWFTDLPALTQAWLLKNAERIIKGELSCPPSVMRFIPGLANVREDLVFFVNDNNKVILHSSSVRLGVPTPVNIRDIQERNRITQLNATQVLEQLAGKKQQEKRFSDFFGKLPNAPKPFAIFQRLLSPVWFIDGIGLSGANDDNTLFINTTRSAIDTKSNGIEVCTPNWPINSLQMFATNPFRDSRNQEARQKLGQYILQLMQALKINGAVQFGSVSSSWLWKIEKSASGNFTSKDFETMLGYIPTVFGGTSNGFNIPQFKLAIAALAQYELLWEQYGANKKIENPYSVNINLRMAALEMIIAEGLGLVSSSGCKSAKDREGVLTMEMTSLKTYFTKHHFIPSINDKSQLDELSSYFADEYLSDFNQQVVSNGNSIGDTGIQAGKGLFSKLEKIITVPQMIPTVYAQKIGDRLKIENPSFTEDALKVANHEISRQDYMGKSANWGKAKTGFKKIIHVLKELFGSKKELDASTQRINLEKKSETIITAPNLWELAENLYIPGCKPVKPVKDDDANIDEAAKKLPAGLRIGNNYTLEPIRQSEVTELPLQYTR